MDGALIGAVISIVTFLVTVFLMILGWTVIYQNASKLARRAENFSRMNSTISDIRAIAQEASKFWGQPHHKENKHLYLLSTTTFTSQIQSVQRRLKVESSIEDKWHEELKELRRSVTLHSEDPFSLSVEEKADKIASIIGCSDQLVEILEDHHNKKTLKDFHSDKLSGL